MLAEHLWVVIIKKISYKYLAIALGILSIILLYFKFNPLYYSFFPKCPFYTITHFYCPGCGSQRALNSLLHFDFIEMINYNLLLPIGLLLAAYNSILKIINRKRSRVKNILDFSASPPIILAFILVFWILRNIDSAPFYYLAPSINH